MNAQTKKAKTSKASSKKSGAKKTKKKTTTKRAKKSNPLYVVSKKGNVVEEASNLLDALVKKLNLAPVLEFLMSLAMQITSQVKSYPVLVEVNKMLDALLDKIESLRTRFA